MAERGAGISAPTIAVLPFDNPSGDPEQEYFARGFVEDVVTVLSRFPTLEGAWRPDRHVLRVFPGTARRLRSLMGPHRVRPRLTPRR